MEKEKEIFYLEPDEEIPSVIGRLEEGKSKKIIFVVPKDAILTHSLINLKLLAKTAKKLKKEVALIVPDETGLNLAKKAGFLVASSLAELKEGVVLEKIGEKEEEEPTEKPKEEAIIELKKPVSEIPQPEATKETIKKVPKPKGIPKLRFKLKKSSKIILSLVLTGLFILLCSAIYLFLPRAKITLFLKTEEKELEIPVILSLSPSLSEIKAEIFEAEKEDSKQGPATGSKEIGEKARGKITIYNYWDSNPQVLIAQTRFQSLSAGKIFRIESAVTVPGTTISQGQIIPGTLEVEVVADEVGAEYNIAPDKFIIPGLPSAKQSKIYGESKAPMSGGYKKTVKVITEEDCNKVKTALLEDLKKALLKEIDSAINKNKELTKKDEFLIEEEKLSICEPQVGSESSIVSAKIKLHLVQFAFKESDFKKGLLEASRSKVDSTKDIVGDSFSKIEVKSKDANLSSKKMALNIKTNVELIPKVNSEALKSNLYFKSKDEAIRYLDSFEEIERSEVNFFPAFLKRIPNRSSQIKIEIKPAS